MNSDSFAWGTGKVVFWDLASIDESLPLESQTLDLKEDLAQISFPKTILIDIGWYPSTDPRGRFVVVVIKNEDWEQPLFHTDANDIAALRQRLLEAIAFATTVLVAPVVEP